MDLHDRLDSFAQRKLELLSDGLINFRTLNWSSIKLFISKFNLTVVSTKGTIDDLKPRVKGDLAIRRLRLKDLVRSVSKEILSFMFNNLVHLDIIMFTNIVLWAEIWGIEMLKRLFSTGIFSDFDTFRNVASKLSAYCKRFPNDPSNLKKQICEINCLTGYLQNDPSDFNFEEDFELLATGGNNFEPESEFERVLNSVMTPQPVTKFITLKEYIERGLWLTAGASSIGTVNWSYAGEKGHFKARKNMLVNIYTSDELYKMAVDWDGNLQNSVFTKDELAKRRLAVASNIEAYLNHSYLLYLFGHGFKNWGAITLDEKPKEQFDRTCKIQKLLREGWFALPFDFKGFDRQPKTSEVKLIVAKIVDLLKPHVPVDDVIAKNCFTKCISCFDHNYLFSKMHNLHAKQSGGLPSGIRPTSLIGNVWNEIKTSQVIEKMKLYTSDTCEIGLRGDDTYVLARSPVTLLLFRYCYAAFDAVGHNEKFGIMQNCCEFLRQNITKDEVFGWPNRAIPSVTQRKPWNPEPWKPGSDVVTTANNIYLLERRLKFKIPSVHLACKLKWSKFTNQSTNWLHLPVHLGGFGIYEWTGWVPDCSLPSATPPVIGVDRLLPSNPLSWISLSPNELAKYSKIDFSSKIASDDVRGPQKFFSLDFIRKFRKLKVNWTKKVVPSYKINFKLFAPIHNLPWPSVREKFVKNELYNVTLMDFLRQSAIVSKISAKFRMMKWLEQLFPDIYFTVRKLESQGFHRTDALNLAQNIIPSEPTRILNPLLSSYVKHFIYKHHVFHWKGRTNIASRLSYYTQAAVDSLQTTGADRLFAY